jgi:AraC-like DNA-binding protein
MRKPEGYFDRSYFHDYRPDGFVPPLTVFAGGWSRWGKGVRYYRKRVVGLSLNLVTMGDARFAHRGFDGTVGVGELTLTHIGHEMTYATGPSGMLHKRFITLGGSALPGYLSSAGLMEHVRIVPVDRHAIERLFKRACALLASKEPGFQTELSMLAHAALLEVCRGLAERYPEPLARAVAYLQRNLRGTVTLEDICREAGMSRRTCIRLFGTHFGTPPVRFFIRQKLRWAEHMLRTTELSIKEIAVTLGYDDPLYFSAQFRSVCGMSPRAFRQAPYRAGDRVSGT